MVGRPVVRAGLLTSVDPYYPVMTRARFRPAGATAAAFSAALARPSGGAVSTVAFSVPGTDALPLDDFHARRSITLGQLARAWVSFTHGTVGLVALDFQCGDASANPTAFVSALSAATRVTVDCGDTTLTAAQVGALVVSALDGAGISATNDSGAIVVDNASGLTVPPAVDMTDESLRGMWGMQADHWGNIGSLSQDLNQNGGTDAVVWQHLGTLPAAGRIVGAYAWCNTGGAQCVMRLAVGTGPAYSTNPGAITIIGEGTATSAAADGFGAVAFAAAAVGASTEIWVAHATDTAGAGLRYRLHSASPTGRGDIPSGQNILVDETRDPSSTNEFGASVTPTVDNNYAIYSALGILFELPDAQGNYPADGSVQILWGDHNPDISHGTQLVVGPSGSPTISDEWTSHRAYPLPHSDLYVTEVSRVSGDLNDDDEAADREDSRAGMYDWPDLAYPSTTAASLHADLGPMGLQVNARATLVLSTPVAIGSDVISGWWSIGFGYTTADGTQLDLMELPVFFDAQSDDYFIDAWDHESREVWHDDMIAANAAYALPNATSEYRSRVNLGSDMPSTSNATTSTALPDPYETDASDDGPAAIALDTLLMVRAGIVAGS